RGRRRCSRRWRRPCSARGRRASGRPPTERGSSIRATSRLGSEMARLPRERRSGDLPLAVSPQSGSSALDLGLWPVVACRHLGVPMAVLVLVDDDGVGIGDALLLRRALRRAPRRVARAIGFRIAAVDLVSPTAVMLDDAIGDLAHATLLAAIAIQL